MTLDLARFWAENAASSNKPFSTAKPRCPISLPVDDHWLLEEMRVPSTVRYFRDPEYAVDVNRQCNDRCEAAIGLRPFRQTPAPIPPLRIEHVFGSHTELTEGGTPWLEPSITTVDQLESRVNMIERLSDADLRALIFSNGGVVEKDAAVISVERTIQGAYSRGPATIATSVCGTTPALYWLVDHPRQMKHFFEVLAVTLVRYQNLLAAERGVNIRGYGFMDDNCALLSPDLYEEHCFPVLRHLFETFAPGADDYRFQHSDSAMAHLLPILSRLDFKAVNFGPTVSAAEIRRKMPRTEVHGQVAPMTLRNGSADDVIAEVRRDFAAAGRDGGLLLTTAGSIAAGTTLEQIRTFMWAVQEFTRY